MTTIITQNDVTEIPSEGGSITALWLGAGDIEGATGWALKPEGLCKGDQCVPIPPGREAEFLRGDQINAAAFWQHAQMPNAVSSAGDVWFLGERAEVYNDALLSLEAPNFTLPDFSGKLHSLTDFRRQKVLLITWASW